MVLPDVLRAPLLTIDLDAVAHNVRRIMRCTPAELMAVVKADGFGAGAAAVARTALTAGATRLGVATLDEALSLRRHGVAAPVLAWLYPPGADLDEPVRAGIELAVSSDEQLAAVAAATTRSNGRVVVHLFADVGMSRDGASPSAWLELCLAAARAQRRGAVDVLGVMGHLGSADTPEAQENRRALNRFRLAVRIARGVGLRPRMRHLAATAATLTAPSTHFDVCRIGAGLVGIDPSRSTKLRPAATLTAPVVSVRDAPRGAYVGYGTGHRLDVPTRLALLPLGYADGIPRALIAPGAVLIRGRRRALVGLVSMDQLVVDVGTDDVRPGDLATVFGPGLHGEPTAAEWAAWAGTIEHDIVTGIGHRVARQTLEGAHATNLLVTA